MHSMHVHVCARRRSPPPPPRPEADACVSHTWHAHGVRVIGSHSDSHSDFIEHARVCAHGYEGVGDPHAIRRDGGGARAREDRVAAAEDVGEGLDCLRQRARQRQQVGRAVRAALAAEESRVRSRRADRAHHDAAVDVRNDLHRQPRRVRVRCSGSELELLRGACRGRTHVRRAWDGTPVAVCTRTLAQGRRNATPAAPPLHSPHAAVLIAAACTAHA